MRCFRAWLHQQRSCCLLSLLAARLRSLFGVCFCLICRSGAAAAARGCRRLRVCTCCGRLLLPPLLPQLMPLLLLPLSDQYGGIRRGLDIEHCAGAAGWLRRRCGLPGSRPIGRVRLPHRVPQLTGGDATLPHRDLTFTICARAPLTLAVLDGNTAAKHPA